MPNPLMRLGTPNRGTKPPDRPEPIAPVVEEIAEPVFPYRGIEDHGVPVHGTQWDPVPEYGDTRDAVYLIENHEAEQHIVPVRIVRDEVRDSGGKEMRVMRIRNVSIGNEPQRVAGRNLNRQSLIIRPTDVVNVGTTRTEAQTPMLAFPLNVSADNTLNTQDEVWLCAPNAGANVVVPVFIREEVSESI